MKTGNPYAKHLLTQEGFYDFSTEHKIEQANRELTKLPSNL